MPISPRKTYFFGVRNVSTQLRKRNFQGNSELFRKSLQYDSSTVELLESPFGQKPAKNAIFLGFMCQNRQQLHPSHLGHQTYEQHQPSALLPGGIGMGYISGGDFFGPGNFDWLVINEINPLSCTQLANPDFGWSNHQLWHCGINSPAMTLAGHLRFRQVTAFPARSWAPGRFRKCRKRGRNPTKSRDPILNLW